MEKLGFSFSFGLSDGAGEDFFVTSVEKASFWEGRGPFDRRAPRGERERERERRLRAAGERDLEVLRCRLEALSLSLSLSSNSSRSRCRLR